jgi:hypothetical protein
MPDARKELLDAAASYSAGSENRLTELFATVLDSHEAFAAALFEKVGLPVGQRFVVRTQEKVSQGCRPDMLVRSVRTGGGLVSELWSEHKTTSGFRHGQREDYVRAMAAKSVPTCLLTVTGEYSTDPPGAWAHLSWQQIGELADAVGRASGTEHWRDAALESGAAARERLLHEFLWYLEREGYAVTRPLSSADVSVFSGYLATLDVLEALMELTARHMGGAVEDGGDDAGNVWFTVGMPDGGWTRRIPEDEVWAEVVVAPVDDWWPAGTGQPAIAAGVCFEHRHHDALSTDHDWLDRLEEEEFVFDIWGAYGRCWRTRALSEVATIGDGLDAQARELAGWATATLEAASALSPPAAPEPERRIRRRR